MYLSGNRYKVIRRLGEGGYGCVYLAEDQVLHKTWAIKEIGDEDSVSYAAIKAEIGVLSKVSHPGIVRITDAFRYCGRVYIVMDYIKGMNLKQVMQSGKKLSDKVIFRWGEEICDAVSYLHGMEPAVILRDIKPQNIMVRPDGHIVLIDFGAAFKHVRGSNDGGEYSFGSRGYASPEQLNDGRADARSDIYAIGKVLDFISGKDKPFGLSFTIRRCTMKKPELRYKSVSSVRRSLVLLSHAGALALASAAILIAGCLLMTLTRDKAEEGISRAKAEHSYEQGLMCFYELDDYEAALRYLDEVPEELYPEKEYYKALARELSGGNEAEKIDDTLSVFEEYNESHVKQQDADRYMKNNFCMAKAYISEGDAKGYEKAYDIMSRVLLVYSGEDGLCETSVRYEADALKVLINILVLEGREDEAARADKYRAAIEYIDELISMPEIAGDSEYVISKRMDEAALLTEIQEYREAIKIYDGTEKDYPLSPKIKYFAHMSLLLQQNAKTYEVAALWDMISRIDGIEADPNFKVMEERVESYIG